ncbi:MAG TPA: glycosyltransferase family 2 protein [Burkholderiaceae bacterium]|nr:glycosyltransferase family 2 protein [Burkholderiaceae bacterium]
MPASTQRPRITIAVPSLNQGRFLDAALRSIFAQGVPVEVYVLDAGSTDGSLDVIRRWQDRLAGWRSHADGGQAAAINEGIAAGSADCVAWLNSDDAYLDGGLLALCRALDANPAWPAVYGRAANVDADSRRTGPVWTEPFDPQRLAVRNVVSQPATLIRRSAWRALGGVDESMTMAFDYDLWWRLYRRFGPLGYVDAEVAVNRNHDATKTRTRRRLHYGEAIQVVRRHHGHVPFKWWLMWPYAVWWQSRLVAQQT